MLFGKGGSRRLGYSSLARPRPEVDAKQDNKSHDELTLIQFVLRDTS